MKLHLRLVKEYDGPYSDRDSEIFKGESLPPATFGIPGMDSQDWWVLALLLRGQSLAQIEALTGIDVPRLTKIISKQPFQDQITIQTRVMVENITRGHFGVAAIAKANAPDAMRRIVGLMEQAGDLRVALKASEKCLDYAGFQPAKRVEVFDMRDMFSRMDQSELMQYAITGILPDRFKEEAERYNLLEERRSEDRRVQEAKRLDPDDAYVS